MIQKFGIFGSPAYLHDTACNEEDLVIPAPGVDREGTAHRLEAAGVTSGLQAVGSNLEVF